MSSFSQAIIFSQFILIALMLVLLYRMFSIEQQLDILKKQFGHNAENLETKFVVLEELGKQTLGMSQERKIRETAEEKVENNNVELDGSRINKVVGGVATALPALQNSSATYLPQLDGLNVVSMSLWGSDPRYTAGAVRNAELIKVFLPGWKLRVYVELPSDTPKFDKVPKDILDKLRELGAELNYMDPSDSRVPPMMWRFLVADDLSVDRFIIRDTDSRISGRDAATIYMWVKSQKAVNCVRDHPSHSGYALSGGLWGGMPGALRDILRRPWKDIMYGFRNDYFQDMSFLINVIYPRVKEHIYCSDSYSCDKWPGTHPFPIPRYGYEHIGQVYDSTELSRPNDVRIMRSAGENQRCSPPRPKAS